MDGTVQIDQEAAAPPLEEICNLPSEERENRIAAFRRNILPLATKRRASGNGMTLDFEYSEALEKQLEELVDFERVCCSDLNWDLRRPQVNVLSLAVSGIPSNSRFFSNTEDESSSPPPRSGFVKKLAQSIGLGATAAVILCCVAPMILATVAGIAIAAPLARLDNPLTIAAGSIAFAIPAWLWLKRREARSSSCGC
jgi:hypothetical protein